MKKIIALALVISAFAAPALAGDDCDGGCNQTAGSGGYVHIPPLMN